MAARRAGESAQGIDADLCIFRTDVEFCEDLEDVEIISLDSNKAEVELAVSITFRADLSYKVPSTGAWDGEDHVLVFQDETNVQPDPHINTLLMKLGLEIGIGKSRPGKGDPLRHPSSKLQKPLAARRTRAAARVLEALGHYPETGASVLTWEALWIR